jgi:hypothetical protein
MPEGQVTLAVGSTIVCEAQRVGYGQLIERAPQPPETTVIELED